MAAWSAQIGSISVTITRDPWPRKASAAPLPTSPYPQTTATLPPIRTSVARLMPSGREWRMPYLLSNLLLVTESLTLMAGKSSLPWSASWYRRWTPVVVSSLTPLIVAAVRVHFCGSAVRDRRRTSRKMPYSSESSGSVEGTVPTASNSTPLCTSMVASPPSSRIMLGPSSGLDSAPGQVRICSAVHQYSSRVSPFQANTGTPWGSSTVPLPTTTAAAASSWVEKMLQDAQRTSAPSA